MLPRHENYRPPDIDPQLAGGRDSVAQSAPEHSMTALDFTSPSSLPPMAGPGKIAIHQFLTKSRLLKGFDIWFRDYHPWFPVIHQQTLNACLDTFNDITHCPRPLLFRAIAVATIASAESCLEDLDQIDMSTQLKDAIILNALDTPCLDSVQALLILSMVRYGDGHDSEASNLLAMCRRCVWTQDCDYRFLYHLHELC